MLVVFQTRPGSVASLVALFAGPLLAGFCGAIIQNLREGGGQWAEKAFLGLGAGAIAALLFLVSQLATSPGALEKDGVETLAAFVVAIGLAAGMTSERVYSSFRKQELGDPTVLEPR
jgi:peptidoglycan/LPS O-acetylase OafA/YrhL